MRTLSANDSMRNHGRPERLHWELFPEFVEAEVWAGGPDPQIPLVLSLGSDLAPQDLVWFIGCYCAHHCVPSAYTVWNRWPTADSYIAAGDEALRWQSGHWLGLPVRPEMRHHKVPEKRHRCLLGFARYSKGWPYRYYAEPDPYEAAWRHTILEIPFYGRYMAIKFLEMLSRRLAPELELGDLRPEGGWSPRRVLSWLFPRHRALMDSMDRSLAAVTLVNGSAGELLQQLRRNHAPNLRWFELQVLLCEYREHWDGGFYPGCTHDEEFQYIMRSDSEFNGEFSAVMEHRLRIFPDKVLGEVQGWSGFRKDCATFLKDSGRVWSDRIYEYPIVKEPPSQSTLDFKYGHDHGW